jgi:hypothetical protein
MRHTICRAMWTAAPTASAVAPAFQGIQSEIIRLSK